MSSVNHDDFGHLKIPLENILSATNNFDEENIIGESGSEERYRGQLLWSGELIEITARRFTEGHKDRDALFWTEVSMLSSLKHQNLVSLVGFCDENDEKIIINKHEIRGWLQDYLSDPMLTWVRRLEISVGLAHALSYIHYDEPRDFSVIHRNINSATVLLNDEWEPKLSSFEHSMKIQVSQRYHSFHNETLQYTDGYADPSYIETKSVNHKSDIYSFGIVLFQLLCGREAVSDDQDNKYLGPVAIFHYKKKILNDIVDPNLWRQMDLQSFNTFAETAFGCLNEERSQRPNIDEIVIRLEKALILQLERGSVSFISAVVESHVTKNTKRVDAKYKKTSGVTRKSNSFRAVLSAAMSGRSAVLPNQKLGGGLSSQLKKSHLDRPFTHQVVKRFDMASRLQSIYENPELPMNAVDGTSSNYNHLTHSSNMLQGKKLGHNLEHLKIGLNDIELATENFSEKYLIGSGGYGMVYKAQLEHFDSSKSSSIDGENKCDLPKKRSAVAIKRIFNRQGEQGYIAEIKILSSIKHENIISLLGFCDEDRDHMILVYELASNGSLEDYLGSSDKMTNLTWIQRLKISLDIAHGLNYIHNNTDQDKQKIIHRDIKSANILLGDNWEAKISDFGLSKFHPADQDTDNLEIFEIAGTPMYFDPEYEKSGKLNKKSDIYSFGVVLFEILTGRLAYDHIFTNVNGYGIAPIARDHFEKGTLMEIVDHKIKEETNEHFFSLSKGPNKESLDIFSKIAFKCLAMTQDKRPSIDDVITELEKALSCQVSKAFTSWHAFGHIMESW